MQNILVAGAGKSSIYLIEYLLKNAEKQQWMVTVADTDEAFIIAKTKRHPNSKAVVFDINNEKERGTLVENADLVISMMPPHLHTLLAKDCLEFGKNLITASYVSEDIKEMEAAAKDKGIMLMNEMGLDPGIDHMTATDILTKLRTQDATVTAFKSYCGGLVAPESDDNPWHYKISWNPLNIVNAGKSGAEYLKGGKEVEVAYEKLFQNCETIQVEGVGELAWLPNRDALGYMESYDVPQAKDFLRATLRYPSFCTGWDAIVQLGLTDENDSIAADSYQRWLKEKLSIAKEESILQALQQKFGSKCTSKLLEQLEFLGLFSDDKIKGTYTSSASILLGLLVEKWKLGEKDKDMVIMQHEVLYTKNEKNYKLTSSLVVKGEDNAHTAMAKTVGLPMGILAKLLMTREVQAIPGVVIPNVAAIYKPVLAELEKEGIAFVETIVQV